MSPEEIKKAITRREFFAAFVPVFSIPVLFWWLLTGKRDASSSRQIRYIDIPDHITQGISFQQGVILVKKGDRLKAYEAKCTHLGCSIHKLDGEDLVCGCHGSRFNMMGKAVKGPAKAPLRELIISEDPLTGARRINMR